MDYLDKLYSHQREDYKILQKTFGQWLTRDNQRKRIKKIIFRAATGYGKTKLASCIVRTAYEKGKKILITAPRINLIKQILQELVDIGIPYEQIGVIQAPNSSTGFKFFPNRPVQISVIDSLNRNWERWQKDNIEINFDFIVIDEAHLSTSNSYKKLWLHYPNAYFLGLTGTPSGSDFSDQWDFLHCGMEEIELTSKGFLPQWEYWEFDSPDISDIVPLGNDGDYTKSQLRTIEDRKGSKYKGDLVNNWIRLVRDIYGNVPTIVFAGSINEANEIIQEYQSKGINAVGIHSKMKERELKDSLQLFISGKASHLINYQMATCGFDLSLYCTIFNLPKISVGCVQLVRAVGNYQTIKQMWGRARGIKLIDGRKIAICLDHAGIASNMKINPITPIHWTLDGKPKKPASSFKTCPENARGCGRGDVPIFATECPYCGYEFINVIAEEPDEEEMDLDKNATAKKIEMTPDLHFKQILGTSLSPAWAFSQFIKMAPTWKECLFAIKEVNYKTPTAFHKWVEGQRLAKEDSNWTPSLEAVLEILETLKDMKKESPLGTYKAWVYSCQVIYPKWFPNKEELKQIEKACGYESGWSYRELQGYTANRTIPAF